MKPLSVERACLLGIQTKKQAVRVITTKETLKIPELHIILNWNQVRMLLCFILALTKTLRNIIQLHYCERAALAHALQTGWQWKLYNKDLFASTVPRGCWLCNWATIEIVSSLMESNSLKLTDLMLIPFIGSWGSEATALATHSFKRSYKISHPARLKVSWDALPSFASSSHSAKIGVSKWIIKSSKIFLNFFFNEK